MTVEPLDYHDGDVLCRGRIALPAGTDKRPGIAVFADIGGVGEHTERYATDLAGLGYVALAGDIYGDGKSPKDFSEGMPWVQDWKSDPARLVKRAGAALDALAAHPRCDGRLGAIGFCFGGTVVLELARHGHPGYLACASFHGDAATPQPASAPIAARILVLHGAEDPLMNYDVLTKFLGEMAAVKADCQTICYTGIVHSFTNRRADGSMGFAKYDEATTRRSWKAMSGAFRRSFRLTVRGALLLLAVAVLPRPALAWGEFGHRTVATIAMAEVKPETRRAIKKLLRHGSEVGTPTCRLRTLENAAVWPDCVRGLGDRYAYSAPWHYQDISVCRDFDVTEACPDGNCVTAQISKQAKILAQKSRPNAERVTALAFLAHFVGDLHQPLHVGEKGDRGGNEVPADYGMKAGGKLNLHHIWDSELAERALTEPPPVGPTSVTPAERTEWAQGNVTNWARESWQAAKDVAYGNLRNYPDRCLLTPEPEPAPAAAAGPRAQIDETYISAAIPVVRTQVEKAGVRLAVMLDAALAKPKR